MFLPLEDGVFFSTSGTSSPVRNQTLSRFKLKATSGSHTNDNTLQPLFDFVKLCPNLSLRPSFIMN